MTRTPAARVLTLALLAACGDKSDDSASRETDTTDDTGASADDTGAPADDTGEGDTHEPPDTDRDGDGHDDRGAGGDDCDDSNPDIHPGAAERCDGVDNDCDGEVDGSDSVDATTWYADLDGDGYGDEAGAGTPACDAPSGSVADATDCDDSDGAVNPGATEVCDDADVDEDCSGAADDADSGVDASTQTTWYPDADRDGYGDSHDAGTLACEQPGDTVADATDCDDGDDGAYPGATELCDGVQTDCSDPSWTDDAGLASATSTAAGVSFDITSTLAGGTSASPAAVTFGSAYELRICEGTWYANLTLNDDTDLIGVGSNVVLDGGGSGRVLRATTAGKTLSVENLTLQNGTASGSGGCLLAEELTSVSLVDVTVDRCEATYAGAASFEDIPSMTWARVAFTGSIATGNNAGGVAVSGVTSLVGEDVTISDNETVGSGGGMIISGSSTVVDLTDLVMEDNLAPDYGGAIYATAGTLTLDGGSFSGNVADGDGGAMELSNVTADLSDLTFSGNASPCGGAVALYGGVTLTGDTLVFDDNTSTGDSAVGFLTGSDTWTCTDCDFTDNTSDHVALKVASGGTLTITNGDFSGNTSYDVYSGTVYTYGTAATFTCDGSSCY